MIKESVTVDDVITLLHQAVALDPAAMQELVNHRVLCNEWLAVHPTIQVHSEERPDAVARVGLLGILNGIFGCDARGYGIIAAVFSDDTGKLIGFGRSHFEKGAAE